MFIKLFFRDIIDEKLKRKFPQLGKVTRLMCKIKFKTNHGWTKTHDAMIDTGAHTTIIPKGIWEDIKYDIIGDHRVGGLVSKEECKLPVKVAEVFLILLDNIGNISQEFKIHSYLTSAEDVPLLLGFKDFLSILKVSFDYKTNEAFIEV